MKYALIDEQYNTTGKTYIVWGHDTLKSKSKRREVARRTRREHAINDAVRYTGNNNRVFRSWPDAEEWMRKLEEKRAATIKKPATRTAAYALVLYGNLGKFNLWVGYDVQSGAMDYCGEFDSREDAYNAARNLRCKGDHIRFTKVALDALLERLRAIKPKDSVAGQPVYGPHPLDTTSKPEQPGLIESAAQSLKESNDTVESLRKEVARLQADLDRCKDLYATLSDHPVKSMIEFRDREQECDRLKNLAGFMATHARSIIDPLPPAASEVLSNHPAIGGYITRLHGIISTAGAMAMSDK